MYWMENMIGDTVEPHLTTTSYIRPPLIKTVFRWSRLVFSLFHIRQTSPNRPPHSDHLRPLSAVPAPLINHDLTSLNDQPMLKFAIFRAVMGSNFWIWCRSSSAGPVTISGRQAGRLLCKRYVPTGVLAIDPGHNKVIDVKFHSTLSVILHNCACYFVWTFRRVRIKTSDKSINHRSHSPPVSTPFREHGPRTWKNAFHWKEWESALLQIQG